MNDDDPTGDEGLAAEERADRERREAGEEASIQVYLDAGWYWDGGRLTHPTDKDVEHPDRPASRGTGIPRPRLGKVMDEVVKREGRDGGLFRMTSIPRSSSPG